MSIGKGLNKVVGKDKRTYLYANSGPVTLISGVATDLLDFRTPNETCTLNFEIFFDTQLNAVTDLFVIKWYMDSETAETTSFKLVNASELVRPIRIHKILHANSPVKVEMQYTKSGVGPPTSGASCNVSGRVY